MTPDLARRQQSVIHAHRVLFRSALSLVSVFAWVFIFEFVLAFSGSIVDAFLFTLFVYALSQLVLMLCTPLSAAHLRHGMRRAMFFGTLLAALAFAVLGATFAGYFGSPLSWGLVCFGLLFGAYRALYWIPYRLQSAGIHKTSRPLFEVLIALLPAFAGITLATASMPALRVLFGAAALALLSTVPLLTLEDFGEPFQWGYLDTFGKLFEPRYQTLAVRSTLSGMESTTLFLLWPVAVFFIVGQSFLVYGLVMTVSLLMVLALRRWYRRLLRKGSLHTSMPLEVAFSVSAWLFRLAAGNPLMIVFADSYSFVSAPAGSPEATTRQHAADAGSYIDEYTALQEIGMAFGGIIMCAFTGVLLYTMPLPVVLALALVVTACVAGVSAILSYKIHLEAY